MATASKSSGKKARRKTTAASKRAINAREERRRRSARRAEAKERDEGHRAIGRDSEGRGEAHRQAPTQEAIAGDADQTRGDDCVPAGCDRREAGRSGRRATRRKREGPRHDLTQFEIGNEQAGRREPSRSRSS